MDETITRLINAGTLGHLCMYQSRLGSRDPDWLTTKAYAMRTFPDLDLDVIDRLIYVCQQACGNAALFRRPGEKKPCGV